MQGNSNIDNLILCLENDQKFVEQVKENAFKIPDQEQKNLDDEQNMLAEINKYNLLS